MNRSYRAAIRALWSSLLLWFVHAPLSAQQYGHGASPGITYAAETSTNLLHWRTAGVILSAPGADGRRTATVARDGPMRFLRLRVGD